MYAVTVTDSNDLGINYGLTHTNLALSVPHLIIVGYRHSFHNRRTEVSQSATQSGKSVAMCVIARFPGLSLPTLIFLRNYVLLPTQLQMPTNIF